MEDEPPGAGQGTGEAGAGVDSKDAGATGQAQELQTLNEKYLRLAAEFENYKRRAQKDQQECTRFANEKILKELLPIIDNLERAVRAAQESGSGEGLLRGVELTLKQFSEMLHRFGVRQMSTVGKMFDPAFHQAVARVESSKIPENHVVDEHQKGYLLQDRILRPAMVTVAGSREDGKGRSEGAEAPDDF